MTSTSQNKAPFKGKVKYFSEQKAHGFIHGDDGKEYYFHIRSLIGTENPSRGQEVEFDIGHSNKPDTLKAKNVRIVGKIGTQNTPGAPESNAVNYGAGFAKGSSYPGDQREQCGSCGKLMVPRVVMQNRSPYRSFCPYCGSLHKKFSACYVATAVYGDVNAPECHVLRSWRDSTLKKTTLGRNFVAWYYRNSPAFVLWSEGKPLVRWASKLTLDLLVVILKQVNR